MRPRAQRALKVIYFGKETTIREDGSVSSGEEVGMEMSLGGTLSSTGAALKMSRAGAV